MVDHHVASILGETVEPRHQHAIFLVSGESGRLLHLVEKGFGGLRDGKPIECRLRKRFGWQSRGSNFAFPRSRCPDGAGNGARVIPLPFVGALAKELFVGRTRLDDGAFAALPAALPFLEFTGTKLARMTAFALATMAAVQGESHTLITPRKLSI
jgi:hypothetical protein